MRLLLKFHDLGFTGTYLELFRAQSLYSAQVNELGLPNVDEPGPTSSSLKTEDSFTYNKCIEINKPSTLESKLRFQKINFIRTTDPIPAMLFENRGIVFYKFKNLDLIEFLEAARD